MTVEQPRLNTTTTRQLLARAGEFELRLKTLEYQQACTTWLMAEFLHNWRVSIVAAMTAMEGRKDAMGEPATDVQ